MKLGLNFAFDLGHSSIGWAVLQPPEKKQGEPTLLGCGTVLFPADECLNTARAGFRRQRRHIAATRNRIKRLKALLRHLKVIGDAELDRHPSPYSTPWFLSARVLASGGTKPLTWPELWAVLRWYAHNRGYDGNAAWAREDHAERDENSEKEKNARGLMEKHHKETMAETVCADLGLDPLGKKRGSAKYFKGNNAAFPRRIVEAEVRRLLELHRGRLPKVDDALSAALLEDWRKLPCPEIRLPQRYAGGLLFGQLIPRFDNRIIPTCRITGQKTPLKHCRAFYRYRWAQLVSDFYVTDPAGARPLTPRERQALHVRMEARGVLSKTELKQVIEEITGADGSSLEQRFNTPETEKALVFDPVREQLAKNSLEPIWAIIPPKWQKVFAGQLFRRQTATLVEWEGTLKKAGALPAAWDGAIGAAVEVKRNAKQKKNRASYTTEKFLNEPITIQVASGRSPYTRKLMELAFQDVFGEDTAKSNPKMKGGRLEETEAVRKRQSKQPIDHQTNNHLVRHRLRILQRLLPALIQKYAAGNAASVNKVTIEVVRDFQQFSGLSNKERDQLLNIKMRQHRKVVQQLEEWREECPIKYQIDAGLIKKARIADDLGWKCPYTGDTYCVLNLVQQGGRRMDREHIIPRKLRPSDSLESLVITYEAVNRMKGRRTATQFMREDGGKPIPGLPEKSLLPYDKFEKLVNEMWTSSLDPWKRARLRKRPVSDDEVRLWKRQQLFRLDKFDPRRPTEFTQGVLTQTSHLVDLANLQLGKWFADNGGKPRMEPLPGHVTANARKSWHMLGCLAQACPRILTEAGRAVSAEELLAESPPPTEEGDFDRHAEHAKLTLEKGKIREITHLHHALDAAVLAVVAHYLPRDGGLWDIIGRRNASEVDLARLKASGQFHIGTKGKFLWKDLPVSLKKQFAARLAEKRVVQHIPRKMSGLKVQQNIWRVVGPPDEKGYVPLRQAVRAPDGKRAPKHNQERPAKLHGYAPAGAPGDAKLASLKGVLIIEENYGIALDPEPQVIPFTHVWQTLCDLHQRNGGQAVRVLRKGMIIEVPRGKFHGRWKIHSVKDANFGIGVDMASPELVKAENKTPGCKMNVSVKTLLRDGITILDTSYAGA